VYSGTIQFRKQLIIIPYFPDIRLTTNTLHIIILILLDNVLIDHLTIIHSLQPTLMFQAISQGLNITDTCQNHTVLMSRDLIFMTTQAFIIIEMILIMDITVVAD
jgi:hypothetical protein